MKKVRQPAVAGMFYPSLPEELAGEINEMLDNAGTEEAPENLYGIVVPHAGYIYSGQTAAKAYKLLKDKKYKTVVVISPSHREYFPGISVFDGDAYLTPLGEIEIDSEMRDRIAEGSKIIFKGVNGHRSEHALEVQLPFLQVALGDFKLLPVVMGDQSKLFVDELSERLSDVVDENTLIVSSSDLSHYYSKPVAEKLDSIIVNRINNFDYNGLMNDLEENRCEACGGGAIVSLMKSADILNRKNAKVLARTDSGDITGDSKEVVGYLSAIVY
jgi:hypothetical protein